MNSYSSVERRVHFASNVSFDERATSTRQDEAHKDATNHPETDYSSASLRWYTSKELKLIRRDIRSSVDADKASYSFCQQQQHQGKKVNEAGQTTLAVTEATSVAAMSGNKDDDDNDSCMRGLEIFSSDVRRDLQKHYARSVIEAQRRIKERKKRKRSGSSDGEEDSVLLQRVAEKYSRYARDRAYEAAVRDEKDCRLLCNAEDECAMPPAKRQQVYHHHHPQQLPLTRIVTQETSSSVPTCTNTIPRSPWLHLSPNGR